MNYRKEINIPTDWRRRANDKRDEFFKLMNDRIILSPEVIMYSIEDVAKISGWSVKVVQRLFNDPAFPSIDYGKAKKVEAHALITYLSIKRNREENDYWMEQVEKAQHKRENRG